MKAFILFFYIKMLLSKIWILVAATINKRVYRVRVGWLKIAKYQFSFSSLKHQNQTYERERF